MGFDGVQEKWIALFSSIVTGAAIVEVYSAGAAGSYDGTLQLVKLRLWRFFLTNPIILSNPEAEKFNLSFSDNG